MGKKLLKTFTNNIGFKILAIAFAFILWLVVYNLNDPVKTKTLPQQLQLQDVIR